MLPESSLRACPRFIFVQIVCCIAHVVPELRCFTEPDLKCGWARASGFLPLPEVAERLQNPAASFEQIPGRSILASCPRD